MYQSRHTAQSLSGALTQSAATHAQLTAEADALSAKGLCQDDFEYYAQRLAELDAHIAYLRHRWQLAEHWEEEAACAWNAAIADAPCEQCVRLRKMASAKGDYDPCRVYCSEACWEIGTAPGYFNARTQGR